MEATIVLNSRIDIDIKGEYFIGVDGGVEQLKNQNLEPNLVLGDFDSFTIKDNDLKNIEIIKYKKEKNFSDGEAAIIEAKRRGFDSISIYGITGGRVDHVYCNVALIIFAGRLGLNVRGIARDLNIFYYSPGINRFVVDKESNVSVFPVEESIIENSDNLLYEYNNTLLSYNNISLGLSNEAMSDEIKINVKKGDGLIFVTKKQ